MTLVRVGLAKNTNIAAANNCDWLNFRIAALFRKRLVRIPFV